jgi:hypothetical protein
MRLELKISRVAFECAGKSDPRHGGVDLGGARRDLPARCVRRRRQNPGDALGHDGQLGTKQRRHALPHILELARPGRLTGEIELGGNSCDRFVQSRQRLVDGGRPSGSKRDAQLHRKILQILQNQFHGRRIWILGDAQCAVGSRRRDRQTDELPGRVEPVGQDDKGIEPGVGLIQMERVKRAADLQRRFLAKDREVRGKPCGRRLQRVAHPENAQHLLQIIERTRWPTVGNQTIAQRVSSRHHRVRLPDQLEDSVLEIAHQLQRSRHVAGQHRALGLFRIGGRLARHHVATQPRPDRRQGRACDAAAPQPERHVIDQERLHRNEEEARRARGARRIVLGTAHDPPQLVQHLVGAQHLFAVKPPAVELDQQVGPLIGRQRMEVLDNTIDGQFEADHWARSTPLAPVDRRPRLWIRNSEMVERARDPEPTLRNRH